MIWQRRLTHRSGFLRLFGVLALALLLLSFASAIGHTSGGAQSNEPVEWSEFNVVLDVQDDGAVHVTETQIINFRGGPFRNGFAEIPMSQVEDIGNVTVTEIDDRGDAIVYEQVSNQSSTAPGTFSAVEQGGMLVIDFHFAPAESETRTFVLEYDLAGAIRVYDDLDPPNLQLWWTPITAETTEAAPVLASTVTVTLPEAVDPADVVILGEDDSVALDPNSYTEDGRTFTWYAEDLESGESFDIRIQFPVIIDIEKPAWQQADDDRREAAEKEQAQSDLYNLIFGALGVLAAIVGGILLYGLWYTRGRDPHVGIVADFLPEPPDKSRPGTVGVLIDEFANEQDLVATMLDLGRRRVMEIDDVEREHRPDIKLTLLAADAPMSPLEKALVDDLFDGDLTAGKAVWIADNTLKQPETILQSLYAELVAAGFYTRSPDATRNVYRRWGTMLAFAAVILLCVVLTEIRVGLIFLPFLVLAILGLILRWQSRHMPRRTAAGAEAAAKWIAFRRYLTDIQKYEQLEESTAIFDKYLPYAIAFGIEKSWVEKFARARTPEPGWLGPGGTVIVINNGPRRRGQPEWPQSAGGGLFDWLEPSQGETGGNSRDRGDSGGGGSLQDWSDRGSRGLQGSSDSLVDLLNSAGRAFGGFGGGSGKRSTGSFGSFGGGSSRGGFSGGGSRGGGGRGGRRGFG